MKTSKIILFSYIGLLAVAFLVFVIYLRAAEDNHRASVPKYTTIEKEVPKFKYIHVNNIMTQIVGSERSYISCAFIEGYKEPELNINMINDTLYIAPVEGISNITLHLSETSCFTIINKSANVNLKGINSDTVNYIGSENSQLNGLNDNKIIVFNVNLHDSKLYSTQGSIEQLTLLTDKSFVNIRNKMSLVKANISDNSDVRLGNVDKIDLEKDDSSKFYCNP